MRLHGPGPWVRAVSDNVFREPAEPGDVLREEASDERHQHQPLTPPRVRIVIESDAADVPEAVLRAIAADAAHAVNGRISVTSVELLVDGVRVPMEGT